MTRIVELFIYILRCGFVLIEFAIEFDHILINVQSVFIHILIVKSSETADNRIIAKLYFIKRKYAQEMPVFGSSEVFREIAISGKNLPVEQ